MMTNEMKKMIVSDFEKLMRYTVQQNILFTIDTFITYSVSLVNFYTGSKLITEQERYMTAMQLTERFNAGIGNRITDKDLQEIANLITSDPTLDYSILNPIFKYS